MGGVTRSDSNDEVTHAFMVLTWASGTMVLRTGEEVNEVKNTGFCSTDDYKQYSVVAGDLFRQRAYRDVSGMFTTRFEYLLDKTGQSGSLLYSSGFGTMKQKPHIKIEDEEDFLYGKSGHSFKMIDVSKFCKHLFFCEKGKGKQKFVLSSLKLIILTIE